MFCRVITASRSSAIGNGLTYEVPAERELLPGQLVLVPLRNKLTEAIVLEVFEKLNEEYDMKSVAEILSPEPLLSSAQIQTVLWMADHYMITIRQALGVWLPPPPWFQLLPKRLAFYRLKNREAEVRGKKQQLVIEYLHAKEWVSAAELRRETAASPEVIRRLLESEIMEADIRTASMTDERKPVEALKNLPVLTPRQQEVEQAIRNDTRPSLLFGVTGSGKTEIYAQLIADCLRKGKQALVLVPEILLTEHSIGRYETLLDADCIITLHSRLSDSARKNNWQRIRRGEAALVLGSRSALFAPLMNLGLIIVDEEHEWTYKNEQTPRYHARETSEALAKHAGAKLVFGTATPSVEAWLRAREGRYQLERLQTRYKEQEMPNVRVIDLAQVDFGSQYPFSPPLYEAIDERLKKHEQCVLFLNRRGIATSLLCLDCRRRIVSPESQLPFTLHQTVQGRPYLMDHTSGLMIDVPQQCPNCQSTRLLAIGAGTHKVEHLLERKFPHARILRADADTLTKPEEMRELLRKMRNREADILLGTQSVVKGLDLPEVTLAAVVLADVGLSLPHFRAGERIFQLLTQLTGRSGRAKTGEVIIQTFRPTAAEILSAANHETEQYLDMELKLRKHTGYPPCVEMVRLILRDDDAASRARILCGKIQLQIDATAAEITAKCAPTFFGGGREWHILLRGNKIKDLLRQVDLEGAIVDVDPMETV